MRKFLVVLLILSVMGGVFAQENSWGKITGEAALTTTMNFAFNEFKDAEMKGDFADVKIVAQWAKTWDNGDLGKWALTLPIRASNGYFGTDWGDNTQNTRRTKANVTYILGDLTVSMPFWLVFSNTKGANEGTDDTQPGNTAWPNGNPGTGPIAESGTSLVGLPFAETNADINADWAGKDFGFKVGVANLYSNPTVSHVGGYFHFMGGRSQLYVSRDSYGHDDFNVYDTAGWFRVSDYVTNPNMARRNAPGFYFAPSADPDATYGSHAAFNQYAYHWANINDNGIAYRFFLMENVLSLGLAFASSGTGNTNSEVISGDNGPIWKGQTLTDINLIDDFLRHPVLGVKYDNSTLGVSAMVGLEPWDDDPKTTDIYIHTGAYYMLTSALKVNGDISARFSTGDQAGNMDPNFNVGVEISYTAPLWAGFGFKMLDLMNDTGMMFGTDFILGFGGAVRDGYTFKGFGDSNSGYIITLKGHVNGFLFKDKDTKNRFDIGLDLMAGWKNFELTDKIKLNVYGLMGLDFWFGEEAVGNHMKTSFQVVPELVWSIWDHGSLTFTYKLGSDDIKRQDPVLNVNNFTTKFKWTL